VPIEHLVEEEVRDAHLIAAQPRVLAHEGLEVGQFSRQLGQIMTLEPGLITLIKVIIIKALITKSEVGPP